MMIWLIFKKTYQRKKRAFLASYIEEYNDLLIKILNSSDKVIGIVNTNLEKIDPDTYQTVKSLLESTEILLDNIKEQFGRIISGKDWEGYEKTLYQNLDCLSERYGKFLYFEKQLQDIIDEKFRWNAFVHEQRKKVNRKTFEKMSSAKPSFFSGCKTKREAAKRYRNLAKKYHPDNGGDPKVFQKIQEEYQQYRKEVI